MKAYMKFQLQTEIKSQLSLAMFSLGNAYAAMINDSNAKELWSAVGELAWAYVHLHNEEEHEEKQEMNRIEAIKRTEEGIAQLDNLVRLLRDEDPDQAGRIHLWCNTLRGLKDQWMNELDEVEGDYAQIQDCRTAVCCEG